jgi:simple sugar transport system ATP-binding protein
MQHAHLRAPYFWSLAMCRAVRLDLIFITHQVTHAMAVGDHFAVLIRGALAANFMRGEKSREQITDLMAGGEELANLDTEIEEYEQSHDGHPPPPVA